MNAQLVVELVRSSIYTTLIVSAPMLLLALVVGLAISILQAITQIQEMTLTFIPKILAVAIALIVFLPWMMATVIGYTNQIFGMIPMLAH
jgi:flagellar biosynthetic protein FliQ